MIAPASFATRDAFRIPLVNPTEVVKVTIEMPDTTIVYDMAHNTRTEYAKLTCNTWQPQSDSHEEASTVVVPDPSLGGGAATVEPRAQKRRSATRAAKPKKARKRSKARAQKVARTPPPMCIICHSHMQRRSVAVAVRCPQCNLLTHKKCHKRWGKECGKQNNPVSCPNCRNVEGVHYGDHPVIV